MAVAAGDSNMEIKLIALDLDRTTLNKEGRLSKRNREAIEGAIAAGIHVVIASGRAFSTLPEDVVDIKDIDYAITSNGAAVYDVPTGQCLHQYKLTSASVEAIMTALKDEAVTYEAFVDGIAYAAKDYIKDPVHFGATPHAIPYIQRTRHGVSDICTFIREHKNVLDSLDVVVRDACDKERIWNCLENEISDVYITSSVSQLVEISYKEAGKQSGLRYVAEKLGIQPDNIMAFGDADNDIDMLQYAGCGVAVANASEKCKQAANCRTTSHDQDGVANILEKLHI